MRRNALLALVCLGLVACGAPSSRKSGPQANTQQQDAATLQVKLGQEYMLKGELETAQDKLRRALELDPRSVDANTLMAVLNERIRRPEVAERFYRRAVELKPEDGSVNNNLGVFLCARGKYDEAERHFKTAVEDPFYRTPAAAMANAGVCARQAGRIEVAERYLRRALELDRVNLIALSEMAILAHGRGEDLRARAFIQRFEARAEPGAELLLVAVQVERRLGDPGAASRYAEQLRERFPDVELPPEAANPSP